MGALPQMGSRESDFAHVFESLHCFLLKQPKAQCFLFIYCLLFIHRLAVYPLPVSLLFFIFFAFLILYFKGTSCSCLHHVLPVSVVGSRTITEIA